jgi:hypothetical protein
MGFERTIPVFERAKTFYASDRAAIVMGCFQSQIVKLSDVVYTCLKTAFFWMLLTGEFVRRK